MKKRYTFTVTMDLPKGALSFALKQYIIDAVSSWRGSLHPQDNPMFNLDTDRIVVRQQRNRRK